MKKKLIESVGVPENLIETAKDVYNLYLDHLNELDELEEVIEYPMMIEDYDFRISDYEFEEMRITTELIVRDLGRTELAGAGFELGGGSLTDKYNRVDYDMDFNKVNLHISVLIQPDNTLEDLINLIEQSRVKLTRVLSHELKHAYDVFKKPHEKTTNRTDYSVYSSRNFLNVKPLNRLIFHLYFMSGIENLVKPSEFATMLDLLDISKTEFYNFMSNDKMYRQIVSARNFTYEKLKSDLLSDTTNSRAALNDLDVNTESMSDEEIVDKILELFYINMVNWRVETLEQALPTNPFSFLFGESEKDTDMRNLLEKYVEKLSSHQDNPKMFYKEIEKDFKSVGNEMIKKIGKTFSLIKDKKVNESIPDFDIWTEVIAVKPKLTTKIKRY